MHLAGAGTHDIVLSGNTLKHAAMPVICEDDVPVDACLYLAIWADGRSIRTVEGESRNEMLSKVQQAFVDEGAVQCGICTPGFVMAATAFVEKNRGRSVSRNEIRRGLAGNLCRCTGYDTIVTAVVKSLDEET